MRKPMTNASLATPAPNNLAMAISRTRPVRRLSRTAADTTPAERTTFACRAGLELALGCIRRGAANPDCRRLSAGAFVPGPKKPTERRLQAELPAPRGFSRGPHFHQLVHLLGLLQGS